MALEEQDRLMHAWWGNYGLSAVSVAVDHCLNGKKAKSEYVKEPILANIGDTIPNKSENVELTEEEKKKQTEQLFMQLRIIGANHKLSQKGGGN
ncbi:MAG: hypothetical protein J6Q48_10545 [Bacteroidaceae bacterium]|nr:hypothetical protein [Bacteroidaceae bacterium]